MGSALVIRFKYFGLFSLVLVLFFCSEPELLNPNHPGSREYVHSASATINTLFLEKYPEGIHLSIVGSQQEVDQWILRPYQTTGDTLVSGDREIDLHLGENGIYTGLDSLAGWEEVITYIGYAKNEAGISRGIDTVSIRYDFVQPRIVHHSQTSEVDNSFQLVIFPDSTDEALLSHVGIQTNRSLIVGEVEDLSSELDSIIVTIQGFEWYDYFDYTIFLYGQDRESNNFGGGVTILPPALNGECRFIGREGFNIQLKPSERPIFQDHSGNDTVRINWRLPSEYTLAGDLDAVLELLANDEFLWRDSISISDWSNSQIDILTLSGSSPSLSKTYLDTVFMSIPIPQEVREMAFIPAVGIENFYIDIFEASRSQANTWIGDIDIGVLPDSIEANFESLTAKYTDNLIPAIAVGKGDLSAISTPRSLPSIEQWRMAASGDTEGMGLPIEDHIFIGPEICNYSNSGDNFESQFPYLQLVPIDFFSEQTSGADYSVYGNDPAEVASLFGIYQMAGNMTEWVTTSDGQDTVLVGGSFWSTPDDSLFNIQYMQIPLDGMSPSEDWGFRTVINDINRPPYFIDNIELK